MLTTSLTELPDHATLVSHSDGHPVARWQHSQDGFERAWAIGGAVGWTVTGRFGHVLVTVGAAAEAGRLATAVLDDGPPVDRIVVPVAALPHIARPLDGGESWDWFWLWTERPPAERPGEASVGRLDTTDPAVAADLDQLLRVSSPRTSARPDDPTVRTWFGARDDDGVLVACASEHEQVPSVWHLRAIATHPDHRGRGLGADITAAVTRAGLAAGAEAVTLGMSADNTVARRLYERLGFRVGESFATRAVVR